MFSSLIPHQMSRTGLPCAPLVRHQGLHPVQHHRPGPGPAAVIYNHSDTL